MWFPVEVGGATAEVVGAADSLGILWSDFWRLVICRGLKKDDPLNKHSSS